MSDDAEKDAPENEDPAEDTTAGSGDAVAAASADSDSSAETPAKEPTGVDAKGDSDALNTDDIEALLAQASGALDEAAGDTVSPAADPAPYSLDELSDADDTDDRQSLDLLNDVELDLRIELGRTEMRLEEVLQLRSGSVVALDKLAGDPVDIFVNGRLIARGEVLVMNDNFCIRVTELVGA